MGARGIGIVLAFFLVACGSEQSKMERGAVVDQEVAAPSSNAEMELPAAQRRAREEREEERATQREYDETLREGPAGDDVQ